MTKALVIGASGGIGAALAAGLAERFQVTRLSRSMDGLDVTDPASVAQALGRVQGPFARVVVATGALEIDGHPPEKTLRAVTSKAMLDQFRLNALGPALVLQHLLPHLDRRAPAVVGVLSARVGSIEDNRLGGWTSYRTAKAALNQIIRTTAVEWSRSHKGVCLLALHPGTVATTFTEKYLGRHPAVSPATAAENLIQVMEQAGPEQSGHFLDYAGRPIPW